MYEKCLGNFNIYIPVQIITSQVDGLQLGEPCLLFLNDSYFLDFNEMLHNAIGKDVKITQTCKCFKWS